MKRMHVNVSVSDLGASIDFYNALFATTPSVLKEDYAKWMLEDPRVNFSITTRGTKKGIDHLGIQVEDEAELGEVYARLETANAPTIEEGETTCCYAHSEKAWVFDPDSIAWETFLTRGESTVYGHDEIRPGDQASACCSRPRAEDVKADGGCC